MHIIESCEKCLYDRQAARVRNCGDEEKRQAFLEEVRNALAHRGEQDASPYMVYVFNQIFAGYFGDAKGYARVKKEYNDLMLSMEADIERKIEASLDPLETALRYARVGNYIDYGAMNHVDKAEFLALLDREQEPEKNGEESGSSGGEACGGNARGRESCEDFGGEPARDGEAGGRSARDHEVYESFCRNCEEGKRFLLLCDNCGEIVLDKLFLRQLKKRFPHLEVTAMVRGQEVLNDATMEEALYCGLDREARLVSNGSGVGGTVIRMLTPEVREVFDRADVILAKGQGNYECLEGCGRHVFYSFLCKCELFTSRFRVPRLTGMFVEEAEG